MSDPALITNEVDTPDLGEACHFWFVVVTIVIIILNFSKSIDNLIQRQFFLQTWELFQIFREIGIKILGGEAPQ